MGQIYIFLVSFIDLVYMGRGDVLKVGCVLKRLLELPGGVALLEVEILVGIVVGSGVGIRVGTGVVVGVGVPLGEVRGSLIYFRQIRFLLSVLVFEAVVVLLLTQG